MDPSEHAELAPSSHHTESLQSLPIASEAAQPTSVQADESVILTGSRVPQEIVDEIMGHLATGSSGIRTLQSCSLVSKPWVSSCQRHLFHTIRFSPLYAGRWHRTFSEPQQSPARHIRELRFSMPRGIPEEFSKWVPWFTNVKKISVRGFGQSPWLGSPLFARLPRSVTSLEIEGKVNLVEVRDVMMQLPNLDDLSLSENLAPVDRNVLPGIGAVLGSRFRGRLELYRGCAHESVVDMLLEVPTGLHFAELYVVAQSECLSLAARLAEACCKTLTKLRYADTLHSGSEAFNRSFNFSESFNLQEVVFCVDWVEGSLHWISTALSTLKPMTSPPLSRIRLHFSHRSDISGIAELGKLDKDLQRIGEEFTRIEKEYGGRVGLVVSQAATFRRLCATDVLRRWES